MSKWVEEVSEATWRNNDTMVYFKCLEEIRQTLGGWRYYSNTQHHSCTGKGKFPITWGLFSTAYFHGRPVCRLKCVPWKQLIFSVIFCKFSAKGSQIVLPDDDLRVSPPQTVCKQRLSLQGCSASMCLSNTAGYVSGFGWSDLLLLLGTAGEHHHRVLGHKDTWVV